jgi:hypothetical protein
MVVGLAAGVAIFGLGQLALAVVPWTWLRLLIIFAYVAPATVAGYSATYGIVHVAMPSPTWQTIFAIVGAIAVSVTAFIRSQRWLRPEQPGCGFAQAKPFSGGHAQQRKRPTLG